MNKSVAINIFRYSISIVIPLLFLYNPVLCFFLVIVVLFVNNVLDDISFYYANYEVRDITFPDDGSPVNGTITAIEYGVPLFSHICKRDIITEQELISLCNIEESTRERWTHIAIFLNKFNHHIVFNPRKLLDIKYIFSEGDAIEMVRPGEILANNKGEYLNNPALVLCYDDMYIVLTLDKYVSRYILWGSNVAQASVMLLKGSQCDIYLKEIDAQNAVSKDIGDIVQIGEELFRGSVRTKVNYTALEVDSLIKKGVASIGGVGAIFANNIVKTLNTFRSVLMLFIVVVPLSLYFISHLFTYVAFLGVYIFTIERFYRNLMYSLVNAVGLKEWMVKSYKNVSKISRLWEKRI